MGVPESRSSDLASLPLQRAGTQADGGAMEASSGIAERSATHRAMRSIILLLYRGVWRRLSACRVRTPANNCPLLNYRGRPYSIAMSDGRCDRRVRQHFNVFARTLRKGCHPRRGSGSSVHIAPACFYANPVAGRDTCLIAHKPVAFPHRWLYGECIARLTPTT